MNQRFLHSYRTAGPHALRLERGLAFGRAFLAVSGLVAIYFDPTEPARFAALVYVLLAVYAVYSVLVLWAVRRSTGGTPRAGLALHGIDLAWAAALSFFSEGPVSPFFLFFLFVLLAAAYRWGFRETLATAVITVTIFLLETTVAVVGPWSRSWLTDAEFSWTPVILRVTYLLITGFLLAILAEREKQFRAEMAATADAMRQPRVALGPDGSVAAIIRLLFRIFGPTAVDLVIHDLEDSRTTLWYASDPGRGTSDPPVRRVDLDEGHRNAWLFDPPAVAWRTVQRRSEASFVTDTLAGPSLFARSAHASPPPPLFLDSRDFDSMLAVDFGLAGRWKGRACLFDTPDNATAGTRLAFLASLTEHITPVLSNVLLVQRLGDRASTEARARVARELHDGAIQALIGIDMAAEALRRRTELAAPALVPELEHIQDLLRREVTALRELMQELRPTELDSPRQLPAVLAALVDRFQRDSGVAAHFASDARTDGLPLASAREIVRITQEALVNIRKHSGAGRAVVRLDGQAPEWRLAVEDDGVGFGFDGSLAGPDLDARLAGPVIIGERVRAIGGHLTVVSHPRRGARVEVRFGERGRD